MPDSLDRLSAALARNYRLERELGQGGMATVYLAEDLRHGRNVAVTVLRSEVAAVLGAERFLAEVRVTARLDHPHILTLIDSGEADGFLWYVLPFVRGQSLRSKLDAEHRLPLDEALAITRQVASALQHAHEHGVIHRDVKPENILLHEREAVITDFGIALAVHEASGTRLTESGLSLGTPLYMSPEQATGERTLDARSDQYSLGAVLYEMLAGEPPHSGASAQSIIAKRLTERPTPLRVLRDSVPSHVEAAVQRALARIPADRFSTMREFADAIGPAASVASLATPFGSWLRRRAPVLAAAAVLGMLVTGIMLVRPRLASRGAASVPDPRHLAVLYFRSQDSSLVPLADGLTEGLIRELSRGTSLAVVSPNGVLPYRGTSVSLDSIARALDVGTVVEGSVGATGGSFRVTVSLVNAPNARVLESSAFVLPRGDVLALPDSLLSAVVQFLRERLDEDLLVRAERSSTRNAAAWQLLLEARTVARAVALLLQADQTEAARRELHRADTLLRRAAAMDRGWSVPLAELARLAYQATDLVEPGDTRSLDEVTARGLQYATSAVAINPDDADALASRGELRYARYLSNLGEDAHAVVAAGDSAEADLRAAVAVDPRQADAWFMLSHLLMRKNRAAEGKLAALRAYESDPYAPRANGLVWRLFAASLDLEDRVEATRWCDEGTRRFPGTPQFIECQITVQTLAGQKPDVPAMWRLLEQNVELYPPQVQEYRRRRGQLLVAITLVRAGLRDSARAVASRARWDAARDPSRELVYIEMLLRNVLGDRDEAIDLAAQYYAANPQDRVDCGVSGAENLDRTWWLRGLVDDPRYRAFACAGR